jgi:diguanylate cyclase (GGDEF)-like protein/PAS domain S-box-containing protein
MDPKPPVNPAEAGTALNNAVRAEQIRLLVEGHADRYLSLLVAAIAVPVVWFIYPHWLLIGWFCISAAVITARSMLANYYLRMPRNAQAVRRWAVVFSAGAAATGILWGCAGSIPLVTASPPLQFFCIMIVGGMMAGGVMIDAAFFPAMAAYAFPAVAPAILILFTRGDAPHLGMAALLSIFSAVIIAAALKLNRIIVQNIRMRLEHDALLARVQASESAMAKAQKLAKVGSWDVNLVTGNGMFSAEASNIFGVDPVTFHPTFETALARVHPDDRPALAKYVAEFAGQTTLPGIYLRLVMDDGAIKYVRESRRKILGADGKTLRIIGSVQDITEHRLSEDRLQFANLLLKTQMEASPEGILVVDANRHLIDSNQRFAEIWGIAPADLVTPDDAVLRAHMAALVKAPAAYATRGTFLAEHPEEIGDEEIELVDDRILARYSRALQSASGQQLGRVWFYSDITERRAAEKDLLLANVLLKTQMEASPDGILVINPNQQIIAFNRRLADIWRISLTELKSNDHRKGIERISANLKDPDAFVARSQYLLDHPDEVGDDEIETLDGRTIDRHSVPLHAEAGGYLGRAWFFSDITERKNAAATLAYRDHLLHAVTAATSVAVRAVSLAEGVPEALRKIGESMGVQRILVLQDMPGDIPPLALRFAWEAPDITVPFALVATGVPQFDPREMAAWRQPLQDGNPVFADAATATGDLRAMLTFFDIKSSVLIPVYVGGHVWGSIGVDDCKATRQWTGSEIETLGILADIAGALIVRERARVALETSEELFRLLAATAKDAVILTGPAGEVLQWNPAAERIFGYTAAEAMGKVAAQLIIRPKDRERVIRNAASAVAELAMTLDFTFMRKDGSEVATEISVSAMPIGDHLGILSILRDITERKIAQAKLEFANILLETQMEASPDGIIAVDASGAIVSFNRRYAEMWSIPLELLEAGDVHPIRAILAALMKDPVAYTLRVKTLLEHADEISDDELETADGRFIERHSRTMHSTTGENFGRVWFMRDITRRREAEALALRLARYDVLTGLANRAVFVEAVNHAIAQAKRGGDSFAILYLDLDHFKDVNDSLGHPIGDALLQEVAARLRASTRATDTVGRFGGDEFAIVATEIKDPADAALLAEKLVAAIAVPFVIDNNNIHTEASIGLDLYSPKSADPETLLSHADTALYRAKSEGRGTYRFFTTTMDRDVHARVRLSGELREALVSGQLFLVYQPQVNAATGKITGLEALIRWNHPTRGVLIPDNFIPVAESTGLIGILGHFVFWTACRQAKAWITAGLPPTRISVNVSAMQFKTALVLEADIMAALNETGLSPNLLQLELTETVLMAASREHNEVLMRLRRLGLKLSIDGFGTGYSSLDYLRRFPVDHIKIAQSFVKNMEADAGDAAVVRAIIGIARVMRINVIAQGVVTRSQVDLLQSWGCNEVQGFYFARPLPAGDITKLLRDGGIIQPKP